MIPADMIKIVSSNPIFFNTTLTPKKGVQKKDF